MQLVINTFGASLTRNGELFRIKIKDRKVELAAKKVQSLLITTSVHFSSDVIQLAIEHNIDIVLLDKYGKPFGRFWDGKMGSTAAIRRAQLVASENDVGLDVVKGWTIAKLANQQSFLEELLRRRKDKESIFNPAIATIANSIVKIENFHDKNLCELRNNIMGFEGTAATAYWKVIGKLPPEEFRFKKRSQHPALDSFNAMLNYAYGVLYSKVEKACIIAGLDPFIGFLHTDNYNKKSLTFDMIEPFRYIADNVVTKLFTGRRCKSDMFYKESSRTITLEKSAKELLINTLNEYIDESVRYKIKSSKTGKTRQIKRLATIQAEAHSLANMLIGKKCKELPQITEIDDLFGDE